MTSNKKLITGGCLALSLMGAGCGESVDQGRSPSRAVVSVLEAASGAEPDEFGNMLLSDVITSVKRDVGGTQTSVPSVFDDFGRVSLQVILRDQGGAVAANSPTELNAVTFTRYRVEFHRSDGRNTAGVDVPYGFDSAVTFTVQAGSSGSASFELVRHTAKEEAPLRALRENGNIIATIADVTFYGRDMAGNDVSVSGSIGVNFGNFADPE